METLIYIAVIIEIILVPFLARSLSDLADEYVGWTIQKSGTPSLVPMRDETPAA